MKSSNRVLNQSVDDKETQTLVPVPRLLPSKTYRISREGKIRDLVGIASVSIFSGHKKNSFMAAAEQRLNGLMQSHLTKKQSVRIADLKSDLSLFQADTKVDLRFTYPVMQPAVTNIEKLNDAKVSMQRVLNKIKDQLTFNNKHKNAKILMAKFEKEKDHYEREMTNRLLMQKILNQLTMPAPFKQFMKEIELLDDQSKVELVRLTTVKESLSFKKEIVKAPYEIMFAYDMERNDFTVGIRAAYDHDHPHPTLLGGLNPAVLVAGTIDLVYQNNLLKLNKMRIDSGHYKPDVEALEVVLRYVRQEIKPEIYDGMLLHTLDGDLQTPEMIVDCRGVGRRL